MTFDSISIIIPRPGGRGYTTCPKCSAGRKPEHKKTKCLTVNDESGNRWWNCNHCGYSGNLDRMEKFSKVYEYAKMPQKAVALSLKHREYLSKRGISLETAIKMNIYERDGRLAFPHFEFLTLQDVRTLDIDHKSKENGIKWLSVPRSEGSIQTAYGLQTLQYNEDGTLDWLIIVEGHMDCLTYVELSIENVISVPDGAPVVNSKDLTGKLEWVKSPQMTQALQSAKKIYIITDNDAPGINYRRILADVIGYKEKTFYVRFPEGYKDSNEIYAGDSDKGVKALGGDGIHNLIMSAYLYPLYGIIRLTDVEEDVLNPDKLLRAGYQIGQTETDQFISLKEKHLWMITGVSGNGKSTWLRWYLTEQAKRNRLRFALYTPENRPAAREYLKILQCWTNDLNVTKERHEDEIRTVSERFININPSPSWYEPFRGIITKETVNTLRSILQYVKTLKDNDGVMGYVIDAWNKLDFQITRSETETNYISRMLDVILEFNDRENLTCFLVAHPAKESKDRRGNYVEPSLMSISGSAHFKNKADVGIIIHREKYNESGQYDKNAPTQVRYEKVKFEELGSPPEDRDISMLKMYPTGVFVPLSTAIINEAVAHRATRREDNEDYF